MCLTHFASLTKFLRMVPDGHEWIASPQHDTSDSPMASSKEHFVPSLGRWQTPNQQSSKS
ncbi:hypothetical protein PA08_1592 [Cutibacterium modestum P08]|nr:hypothetical protein PA08_1592 [Cutibacterium modestum P08]